MFKATFIHFITFTILFIKFGNMQKQKIKILYINENVNKVSNDSVHLALKYIKEYSNFNMDIDLKQISIDNSDLNKILELLCDQYDKILATNSSLDVILDLTKIGTTSESVKYFTKLLDLPIISSSFGQTGDIKSWKDLTKEQMNYLVQVRPPADIIPDILRAFVIHQKFSNVGVLYDDSFVMKHKYATLLQNISIRQLIVAINFENIEIKLKQIQLNDVTNIIIFGTTETITKILEYAERFNLMKTHYAWYAVALNNGKIKSNCSNVTILYSNPSWGSLKRVKYLKNYNITLNPDISSVFYFDLTIYTALTIRNMKLDGIVLPTNTKSCKTYSNQSNIIRNINLKKYFQSIFKNNDKLLEFPIFNQFVLTKNGESQMLIKMDLSFLNYINGILYSQIKIGVWNSELVENFTIGESNLHLMNMHVPTVLYRVVTRESKPFVYIDKKSPKGVKGFCIDLLDEIANYCNFSYEIYLVKDGLNGVKDEHDKWNGMIGELVNKRADIAISTMFVNEDRINAVDFTIPFYEDSGITILMKEEVESRNLFKFLTVFTDEVWLCIFAAFIFISVILWFFDRYSPYSYQNNKDKYKNTQEKRLFTFGESLWFCVTSLTPHGAGEAPRNFSGILIAGAWWLFGFIIISSYTASLAATFTVKRLDNPIQSFDDLIQQYSITYGVVNGSNAMEFFIKMTEIEAKFHKIWESMSLNDKLSAKEKSKFSVWEYPISNKYTKMWEAMQRTGLPATEEEAVQRVLSSKSITDGFAYIGDATNLKYLELLNCDLKVVGEEFSEKPYAIAVQKDSTLKNQITYAITDIISKRKLEALKQKWWEDNPEGKNCRDEENLNTGIKIHNVSGVLIIVFVGVFISYLIPIIQIRFKNLRITPKK